MTDNAKGWRNERWGDNWEPIGWRTDAHGEIYHPVSESGGREVLGSSYVNWLEHALAGAIAAHNAMRPAALDVVVKVLRRLEQWDHMQSAADGPYWLREIANVLGEEHTYPERAAIASKHPGSEQKGG